MVKSWRPGLAKTTAVNIDDRFVPLQKRLETSMNELTGIEAEVQS